MRMTDERLAEYANEWDNFRLSQIESELYEALKAERELTRNLLKSKEGADLEHATEDQITTRIFDGYCCGGSTKAGGRVMSYELKEALNHAERYFLEASRGSEESEEYYLAEACHLARKRIAELDAENRKHDEVLLHDMELMHMTEQQWQEYLKVLEQE